MTETIRFPATQALRAFYQAPGSSDNDNVNGNVCLVTLVAEQPDPPPAPTHITHCVTWPLGPQIAGARCWTDQGVAIACCGHGLLCCAAVWMKHWGQHGTLIMNGSQVECRIADGRIWLGFQPLQLHSCDIPEWCRATFGVSPIGAATAAGENGYLVLQWPEGFDLTSLPRPDIGLARYTARSLIVTSAAGNVDTQPVVSDIQYRYFAPQYGVSEDAATGSAMRVLAGFWQQRGLGQSLTAYQASPEGGLLFSRIAKGKVWIGGQTASMAQETARIE